VIWDVLQDIFFVTGATVSVVLVVGGIVYIILRLLGVIL